MLFLKVLLPKWIFIAREHAAIGLHNTINSNVIFQLIILVAVIFSFFPDAVCSLLHLSVTSKGDSSFHWLYAACLGWCDWLANIYSTNYSYLHQLSYSVYHNSNSSYWQGNSPFWFFKIFSISIIQCLICKDFRYIVKYKIYK